MHIQMFLIIKYKAFISIYITLSVLLDEFIKQGEAEMSNAFLQICYI